tara:strand:+ start:518 stop:823 length:306 start_codon:yes stop_codon:yes gene_type:complete
LVKLLSLFYSQQNQQAASHTLPSNCLTKLLPTVASDTLAIFAQNLRKIAKNTLSKHLKSLPNQRLPSPFKKSTQLISAIGDKYMKLTNIYKNLIKMLAEFV